MSRRSSCGLIFLTILFTLAMLYICSMDINLWHNMKNKLNKNVNIRRHTLLAKTSRILQLLQQKMKQIVGSYDRQRHNKAQQQQEQQSTIIRYVDKKDCPTNGHPHNSIFYINIGPNTASTNLRNSLLLYGRQYNLSTCIGSDGVESWKLNRPDHQFSKGRLIKVDDEKCNIFTEELVYNPKLVDEIMTDDVFIMTSIRHPVQHFMSLYETANVQKAVEKLVNDTTTTTSVDKWTAVRLFLQHYDVIKNVYATFQEDESHDAHHVNLVGPNAQTYSLGLSRESSFDEIEQRVRDIDFITIAEKFEESMVILRDKLCCSYQDLVYRSPGSISKKTKNLDRHKEEIPEDIEEAITHFNLKDMYLYKLAMKRLYEEILERKNFEQVLGIYRYELRKYQQRCNKTSTPKRPLLDTAPNCLPLPGQELDLYLKNIRYDQREFLLAKLRQKYKQRI